MNHEEAGRYWNQSADVWTRLARAGYDVYRDHLNTPAFFAMLPEVRGLSGLDIGCGEGHNTRLLARKGARMTGLDIAGFALERVEEPRPDDETVKACPDMQDARIVAYFLHVRARRPVPCREGDPGRNPTGTSK